MTVAHLDFNRIDSITITSIERNDLAIVSRNLRKKQPFVNNTIDEWMIVYIFEIFPRRFFFQKFL